MLCFFFFKQKTAYEMRISDWSSDVCSSDLTGADGLECDVRLTADGHLVCVHDRDLRRTASNSGVVSTMELAELDAFDFGSWKNPWHDLDDEAPRPEERRGGKEGVSTCRSRWAPDH